MDFINAAVDYVSRFYTCTIFQAIIRAELLTHSSVFDQFYAHD